MQPDALEVAEWFHVDLATLMTASHEVRRLERDGVARDVHFYQVGGTAPDDPERVIWGVTGAIIHELMRRLGRQD